jgi:hypothetical protein
MSVNYQSGYAGHITTTFGADSWHRALIFQFNRLNHFLTAWVHLSVLRGKDSDKFYYFSIFFINMSLFSFFQFAGRWTPPTHSPSLTGCTRRTQVSGDHRHVAGRSSPGGQQELLPTSTTSRHDALADGKRRPQGKTSVAGSAERSDDGRNCAPAHARGRRGGDLVGKRGKEHMLTLVLARGLEKAGGDGNVKICGGWQRGRQAWRRRFWPLDVDSFDEHVPIDTAGLREASGRMGTFWSGRSTSARSPPEAERTGWCLRLSTHRSGAACWLGSAARTHARRRAALAEDEWRLGGSGGLRRVVAQAVEREGWGWARGRVHLSAK